MKLSLSSVFCPLLSLQLAIDQSINSQRFPDADSVTVDEIEKVKYNPDGTERQIDVSKTTKESTDNSSMSANIYDPLDRKITCTIPWIQAIKVVKKGAAWRAKLYTERTFCSHKAVRKLVKK